MTAKKPKKVPKKPRASVGKGRDESRKKRVIRCLFALRALGLRNGTTISPVVTLSEVQWAIERANQRRKRIGRKTLSTRNPANFFKDIVRREATYRSAWPKSALARGYIGRQSKGSVTDEDGTKGESPCFEFVRVASGNPIGELYQQVPPYNRPATTGAARVFDVQTLELPPEVRRLKRQDETFLLQLIVRLRVIETHLSIVSRKGMESLTHLQMGVKLRDAEVDALFLGDLRVKSGKERRLSKKRRVLVALEAKGNTDDILRSQIEDQAEALFDLDAFKDDVDFIVPMAAKLVAASRIYVAEYRFIARSDIAKVRPGLAALRLASEAFYDFIPPVGGLD